MALPKNISIHGDLTILHTVDPEPSSGPAYCVQFPSGFTTVVPQSAIGKFRIKNEDELVRLSVYKTGDPKYGIHQNALVNRESCEKIPDDEPVMLFRAKDSLAVVAIQRYYDALVATDAVSNEHIDAVHRQLNAFKRFAATHTDRMKIPDTTLLTDDVFEVEVGHILKQIDDEAEEH